MTRSEGKRAWGRGCRAGGVHARRGAAGRQGGPGALVELGAGRRQSQTGFLAPRLPPGGLGSLSVEVTRKHAAAAGPGQGCSCGARPGTRRGDHAGFSYRVLNPGLRLLICHWFRETTHGT